MSDPTTDLLLGLLLAGTAVAVYFIRGALERETGGAADARPWSAHARAAALQAWTLLACLPLFAWLARAGRAGPADPETASRLLWTGSFLWFWLRAGGFLQLLLTVPAARSEQDPAERRLLRLHARLAAAVSGAAVFIELSRAAGRGAALPTAAGLTAGLCALYAVWLALRLGGRLR